jgi:hypothetical protein
VTGVQTCALPIFSGGILQGLNLKPQPLDNEDCGTRKVEVWPNGIWCSEQVRANRRRQKKFETPLRGRTTRTFYLFGRGLCAWDAAFQEFDLAVVVGFVFGHVKPFGVIVGGEIAVCNQRR